MKLADSMFFSMVDTKNNQQISSSLGSKARSTMRNKKRNYRTVTCLRAPVRYMQRLMTP